MADEMIVTVNMLSRTIPITLSPPYTIEHLRNELLHETDMEGKGVEHLSLYNTEGRCQLDDDLVQEDQVYRVLVHARPIIRYYIEDVDEIHELEVETVSVREAYHALWKSMKEDAWLDVMAGDQFYFTLRKGGMWLYDTDELDDFLGKEITVKTIYHVEPYELE